MDLITWFVPQNVRDDHLKCARYKGITKSLLSISLVTFIALLGALFAQGYIPTTEYALFAAAICTPTLGAMLIRATGNIKLGLVITNIGGILIVTVWALLTGGIASIALPIFLANLALLSTFGNAVILLIMGGTMMVALVFLYLVTSSGWLPPSSILQSDIPVMMLTSMLGSVGVVVLAGVMMARDRAIAKASLHAALHAAEKSGRVKSAFLESMSSELQTPINAILEFADILQTSNVKSLDEEQLSIVSHIVDAGKHLLGLVTQVLEISRIEDGKFKLNIEPIRIEDM